MKFAFFTDDELSILAAGIKELRQLDPETARIQHDLANEMHMEVMLRALTEVSHV